MSLPRTPPALPDIRDGRLPPDEYAANFADIHPPLTPCRRWSRPTAATSATTRPAPTACPTGIDIPSFIHRSRTGNLQGCARTPS